MEEHFEWVKKVIDSCKDGFQLECARNMIEIFKQRYSEHKMYSELIMLLASKDAVTMVL